MTKGGFPLSRFCLRTLTGVKIINVRKMKFYARDYVRRIYVVQFPMPRFFQVFTHVTRRLRT